MNIINELPLAYTTTDLKTQQKIFSSLENDDNTFVYLDNVIDLICNKNLHPEVFVVCFLKFKDLFEWQNIKYNNPETQELLEKSLLLK